MEIRYRDKKYIISGVFYQFYAHYNKVISSLAVPETIPDAINGLHDVQEVLRDAMDYIEHGIMREEDMAPLREDIKELYKSYKDLEGKIKGDNLPD